MQDILNMALPQWELLPDIGLYMDQVITLMDRTFSPALPKGEMTKSMVNNYVKVGMIPRPVGKKYDREHLAMLLMICVFKQALSMESISRLLGFLCERDVRTGYDQFCAIIRRIEESAKGGRIELFGDEMDEREMALRRDGGAVHHTHLQAAGKGARIRRETRMKRVYAVIGIE